MSVPWGFRSSPLDRMSRPFVASSQLCQFPRDPTKTETENGGSNLKHLCILEVIAWRITPHLVSTSS